MSQSAKLILPDGKEIILPVKMPPIGQDVMDISALFKESGMAAFDPGFLSTASCESKITFIDGGQGVLRHAGYAIEDLAQKVNFRSSLFAFKSSITK